MTSPLGGVMRRFSSCALQVFFSCVVITEFPVGFFYLRFFLPWYELVFPEQTATGFPVPTVDQMHCLM